MGDLPAKPSPAGLAERYEDAETVYSVLRNVTRVGPWAPPETMRLVSVLGHVVLDYRDADLPLGVTAVECQVFLGSVEIIVPPDVDLELTGSVFLGSVETRGGRSREPGPADEHERPLLSIDCSGMLGSVEVKLA